MAEYDAIADEYAASKQLPWRVEVEQPTLFGLMGDVRGRSVLDLACGDGIYARMLADRGASRVHGVDLSGGMIELAQRAESARPRGITYSVSDAAEVRGLGEFDVVMAAYLFNYAQDRVQLRRMAESAFRNLRPGGRLCGVNDNPRTAPSRYRYYPEFSFLRYIEKPQREGSSITWSIQPATGDACIFDNFWIPPATYREVFEEVGFADFRFVDAHVAPGADPAPFRDFLEDCPICGISAVRPGTA
jgi:ubiquinone/menaquinone biosynthesis C-methylase UbiE